VTDGRTDGHNYDSQDRASIAESRGNNNHWGTVSIEYPRASFFYDIQWKRICGIPFILKSHDNTDATNQNAYFKPTTG